MASRRTIAPSWAEASTIRGETTYMGRQLGQRLVLAFSLTLAGSLSGFASACNISNVQDLRSMSTSGNYTLCQDFDAVSVNFVPIGTYTNPFIGTLDGNGFTIKNLTIISAGAD